MESSAINAPHPDDAAQEAEDFFGGGVDEAEADAPTDPGTFEPEADEPQAGGPPTLSPEQAEAEAVAYREERGEQHPKPSDHVASPEAAKPDPSSQAASDGPTDEDEGATRPTPAADGGTTSSTTEPGGKQSGSLEREYVVFQKLPLTKRVLEHLLKQLEERGGEPRVAHFEIHRTEARNVNAAIATVYKEHKARLGEKCDMAAVSSKSFQERHVEPRPVQVDQGLSIS